MRMTWSRIITTTAALAAALLLSTGAGPSLASPPAAPHGVLGAAHTLSGHASPGRYTNPLRLRLPNGHQAVNCADPFVLKGTGARAGHWYLYCTSDVLDPTDLDANGDPRFATLPMYSSTDMVTWRYQGQAVAHPPRWVGAGNLWAPDVVARNGRYYLYYAASDTRAPDGSPSGGGTAIGALTSSSPLGPWTDSGGPVVEDHSQPVNPTDKGWVIDPEVISAGGGQYIYFGSFGSGIWMRRLSTDGLHSSISTESQVANTNHAEGAFVMRHDGWFYLMASATNCCNGPLTGYIVLAGRSHSPRGPFLDRDGRSLKANRVGGTPVLAQNGNQWIGVGHNAVVSDYSGQQWIYYHAIDQNDPYVPGLVGYTQRTLMVDPLDWKNGWPTVNGGRGPSNTPHAAPAAQPGQRTAYRPSFVTEPRPGAGIAALSDGFSGRMLSSRWTWVRQPDPTTYRVGGGLLSIDTSNTDLQPPAPADQLAPVLTEPAPRSDYVVQTRVRVNVPNDGSTHNYVQGGLLIYNDDANYVKLSVTAIGNTRQSEFGKHVGPVPQGYPAYGNSVVGPVGEWTYLRIVHHAVPVAGTDQYTSYTSLDGRNWDKGSTWDQPATTHVRIGLVSMGGPGPYTTSFASIRVSRVDTGGLSLRTARSDVLSRR